MAWISPKATAGVTMLWNVVLDNDFFLLLEYKAASSRLVSSVVSVVRRVGSSNRGGESPSQPLRYRIVLKDDDYHAVAVSEDFEEIQKNWQWINENILPKLSTHPSERPDMIRYALDKFESLAKDAAEGKAFSDETLKAFQERFELINEPLVAYYFCSLWRPAGFGPLGTHRAGTMWISQNYICFNSPMMEQKIVTPFRIVTAINKETSTFGVLANSIGIITKDKDEYFFSNFFNRDLTYELMTQLWGKTMEKLLFSCTSNTNATTVLSPPSPPSETYQRLFATSDDTTSPSVGPATTTGASSTTTTSTTTTPAPASASATASTLSPEITRKLTTVPGDKSKEILRTSHLQAVLNLFRLNAKEVPETEISCSLYLDATYLKVNVYLSATFLYFNSIKDPIVLGIIPWANIVGISKDNPFISAVTIITSTHSLYDSDDSSVPSGELIFSFVGQQNATEQMNGIYYKWKQVVQQRASTKPDAPPSSVQREPHKGSPTTASSPIALPPPPPDFGEKSAPSDNFSEELERELRKELEEEFELMNLSSGRIPVVPTLPTDTTLNGDAPPPDNVEGQDGLRPSKEKEKELEHGWEEMEDTRPFENIKGSNSEQELENKWEAYFLIYGRGVCMLQTPALRDLIRCGIPASIRPFIWQVCSGAIYNNISRKGLYEALLESNRGKVSEATDEIERDLHRSLPEDGRFQTEEGINSLRNVLHAFSWFNTKIGYCQGMNIVVANLLCCKMTEEECFFMLDAICSYLVPQYYAKEMLGSLVDQQILEELVQMYMPEVIEHLHRVSIPISLITLPWLLCLFIGHVKPVSSLRVLDCFFYEGPNILFSFALSILRLNENDVISAEYGDEVVDQIKAWLLENSDLMFQVAFTEFDSLPHKRINRLRNTHKYRAIMELEDNSKKKQFELLKAKTLFDAAELETLYEFFQDYMIDTASLPASAQDEMVVDVAAFQRLFDKVLYFWKGRQDLMELAFRYLDRLGGNKGFISFVDFVLGVSPLCKGGLEDQLLFCLKIHDFKNEGAINTGSLYNALDALLRLYGDSNEGGNEDEEQEMRAVPAKVDLDAFVLLLFEKTAGGSAPAQTLSFATLKEVLLDTPLLAQLVSLQPKYGRAPHWAMTHRRKS